MSKLDHHIFSPHPVSVSGRSAKLRTHDKPRTAWAAATRSCRYFTIDFHRSWYIYITPEEFCVTLYRHTMRYPQYNVVVVPHYQLKSTDRGIFVAAVWAYLCDSFTETFRPHKVSSLEKSTVSQSSVSCLRFSYFVSSIDLKGYAIGSVSSSVQGSRGTENRWCKTQHGTAFHFYNTIVATSITLTSPLLL